jgi:hypothetical protein
MPQSIPTLTLATALVQVHADVADLLDTVLAQHRPALTAILQKFLLAEVTPQSTFSFERELAEELRQIGAQTVEVAVNSLEGDQPQQLPHDVYYEGGGYRQLKDKTANRHVATLFGTITLHRHPYRYWHRDSGESCLFPLEIQLGLRHGATPALAEAVARYMAQAGATQQAVLERLRLQHGVTMGVERLRNLTAELSEALAELTPEAQADRLLELLAHAGKSRGNRKPVLAVGRDGITLRNYPWGFFEIATVATLTVYDRAGKRLGTVYLSVAPELGQATLTARLTALIEAVLRRWEGPLPRLCYVTDAGDEETKYYYRVLWRMKHPRTGEKLAWTRIIDYYHASSRTWTMADALFGKGTREGRAWALRMCRLLKKPSGVRRVLYSAAALRGRRKLSKARGDAYQKAYRYLQKRTRQMQYHEYRGRNLPIGSGVTEAACKTVVTQRLKLSGMRWEKANAQKILDLRVVWLSGIWDQTYRRLLTSARAASLRTYRRLPRVALHQAA